MKMQLFRGNSNSYSKRLMSGSQSQGEVPASPSSTLHILCCAFQLCTVLSPCFLTLSVEKKIACHPYLTTASKKRPR